MMKQIKVLVTIITWLTYFNNLSAQIVPEWTANYASNYPVSINESDMVTDKNGNVYITGYTTDTTYKYNVVTLKYNSSGQFQWIQYYDSISYYSKIAVDDLGNCYVSGQTVNGSAALLTIKYNSLGVLQWAKSYLSSGPSTWAYDIIADDLSNVYVTGLANGNKLTTIKYNALGTLQWAVSDSIVNGSSNSYITLDNKRNVYIAGRSDTTNYASACKTIKYNSAGIKQWSRIYTSNFNPGLSGPRDLKYDQNGFIYLLASSTNNNDGDGDIIVVKYDTLGNQQWALPTSFTSYYDVPTSMTINKSGDVYVTGSIWPTGGTVDSLVTFKISNSGIFKWAKKYSSGYWNNDEASGIGIDSLGFIYIAGISSDNANAENFITIKYDSLGNQIWVGRYKNTLYSYDYANSISIDKFGNIYVSGTTNETNSSGILTIKYSNAVGIEELTSNSGASINILPNPFETYFILKSNKDLNDAELIIYDAFGKEVSKINGINNENIFVQRNNLADGIYFYRLIEKNQVISQGKIIAK